MKNIIYKLIIPAILMNMAWGCSSDDTIETDAINIVSADVDFTFEGGKGTIVVEAPGTIEASSQHPEWCAVSVNGNEIRLTVEPNDDIVSRYSAVTIKAAGEEKIVSVSQIGMTIKVSIEDTNYASINQISANYFQVDSYSTVASDFTVRVDSFLPVEVRQSGESWIGQSQIGDSLFVFSVPAVAVPRTGYAYLTIEYPSGAERELTFEISQGLDYFSYLGEWDVTYSTEFNPAKGLQWKTVRVNFVADVEGESLYIEDFPYSSTQTCRIYATYNSGTKPITIPSSQYLFTIDDSSVTSKYVFFCLAIVNAAADDYTFWYAVESNFPTLEIVEDYTDGLRLQFAYLPERGDVPSGFTFRSYPTMTPASGASTNRGNAFYFTFDKVAD